MRKEQIFGAAALVIVMVSLMAMPPGYARQRGGQLGGHAIGANNRIIQAVSNPSGSCVNLGLGNGHGVVIYTLGRVVVSLQSANPSSTYSVSVGYVRSGGACDGTWQSIGSLSTDAAGNGNLTEPFHLSSGHKYVFELTDGAGTVVYASPILRM